MKPEDFLKLRKAKADTNEASERFEAREQEIKKRLEPLQAPAIDIVRRLSAKTGSDMYGKQLVFNTASRGYGELVLNVGFAQPEKSENFHGYTSTLSLVFKEIGGQAAADLWVSPLSEDLRKTKDHTRIEFDNVEEAVPFFEDRLVEFVEQEKTKYTWKRSLG